MQKTEKPLCLVYTSQVQYHQTKVQMLDIPTEQPVKTNYLILGQFDLELLRDVISKNGKIAA